MKLRLKNPKTRRWVLRITLGETALFQPSTLEHLRQYPDLKSVVVLGRPQEVTMGWWISYYIGRESSTLQREIGTDADL